MALKRKGQSPRAEVRPIDQITDDDLRIFALGSQNANYITDFYLRGPNSGTFWRAQQTPPDPEREAVWKALYREWKRAGMPEPIFYHNDTLYEILWDNQLPTFFHRHGWLFQPWQLECFHDPRPEQTIIGGFGCIDATTTIFDADEKRHVPIKHYADLKIGPKVLAWTGRSFLPIQAQVPRVMGVDTMYHIRTKSGRTMRCTAEHRFRVADEWVKLKHLRVGSHLWAFNEDTGQQELDSIYAIDELDSCPYYDFHVPIFNNYVGEGLINHNCGKTAYISVSAIIAAMTVPYSRTFCFAPQLVQTMEVYNYIKNNFSDTPFWQRFVWGSPQKPIPKIMVKNSYVGETTIEFYSIEHDSEKIRTLEGDQAFIDQAEKLDNLPDIIRDVGTRLRGQIAGRQRIGKLVVIANAGDNPELWSRYDQGEYQPDEYLSRNPSSFDNPYLTERDRKNLARRVSADASPEELEQWMHGQRPLGKGEYFSSSMVKGATDPALDHIMDERIAAGDPSCVKIVEPKVHIRRWELPPAPGRMYCTLGDPGHGNPPDRNSGVVMTWDITDFPKQPATLQAFTWVSGRGSIMPFFHEFIRHTDEYHTKDRCGYDSTGAQKGYSELGFENFNIIAEQMDMSGQKKNFALNSAKVLLSRGLMKFPYIAHLSNQLTNYRLPDNKLRQDLVMTFAMSAAFIRRFFYYEPTDEVDGAAEVNVDEAYNRYKRPAHDRYQRRTAR